MAAVSLPLRRIVAAPLVILCHTAVQMWAYCSHLRPNLTKHHDKIYQRILHIEHDPPQFDVSFGLLLRDDLHHAFDRLEWSFYDKVSRLPTWCGKSHYKPPADSNKCRVIRTGSCMHTSSISACFPTRDSSKASQFHLKGSVLCRRNTQTRDSYSGIIASVSKHIFAVSPSA